MVAYILWVQTACSETAFKKYGLTHYVYALLQIHQTVNFRAGMSLEFDTHC